MCLYDRSANGEAQTEAVRFGRFERLKQVLERFVRQSLPVVGDHNLRKGARRCYRNLDLGLIRATQCLDSVS